jgi:hypothetical protein
MPSVPIRDISSAVAPDTMTSIGGEGSESTWT